MGRKVGGTQKHTKKAVINKKYTPPVKTNISKHPKVYRPSPSHTTTPATRTQPAHTTGIHGASYGVTQTAPARDLQQNLRTNTVNTAHRARFVATSPITATYAAVTPNLPPSVQAAVHSTVSTVRNVLNPPVQAAQQQQPHHGSGVQKGIYYGTNPQTGETQRFDTGGRPLDAQTRQSLTQQGWTITSTPPKGSQNWQWSQGQNTFVPRSDVPW